MRQNVFLAPPPTTNALSRAERARLLRSSKKIARVLGATPRYIDTDIDDVQGIDDTFLSSPSVYRNSVDTVDSVSSSSTNTSTSTSNTSNSSLHSLRRSHKPLSLSSLQDIWPARKHFRPRLSLETSLESIPASPLTPNSTPESLLLTMSRTIPPRRGSPSSSPLRGMGAEPHSLGPSPPSPSFMIPSHAAACRRKLERLRRTLGDDVPVCLIFPQGTTESDSDSGSEPSLTPSSEEQTSSCDELTTPDASPLSPTGSLPGIGNGVTKPEGKPLPRPSRKKKIANTRDSLILASKPPPSTTTKIPKVPEFAPRVPHLVTPSKPPGLWPASLTVHVAQPPSPPTSPGLAQVDYEHPPIVHRRSHSGGSAGLRVILEERGESGWYESDCEEDTEFEFIQDDEVLGAVGRLGDGGAGLYGGPVGKGMGRGLAKSYATRF
ncbi:hypothetical protein C0992_006262 [Termitomyces sp. T32_za158]|nr:hypothetical protein C0992_006262 [Termitomyces sp. T32_za158]